MSRPWMPLYTGDYLRDTTHLMALESGAYLHLIMHYWNNGGLPEDDRLLATIAKLTAEEWTRCKPVLQAFFKHGWKHDRIEIELTKTRAVSERYAARARKAAGKRWSHDATSMCETMLGASEPQPQSEEDSPPPQNRSSSAISSETKKERVGVARARSTQRASRLPDDWTLCEADREFAAMLLPPEQIDFEFDKFCDYWHARAGPRAVSTNWSLNWKNWVRREATGDRSTKTIRNGFAGRIAQEPGRSYASANERRWTQAFENVERAIVRAGPDVGAERGQAGASAIGWLFEPKKLT